MNQPVGGAVRKKSQDSRTGCFFVIAYLCLLVSCGLDTFYYLDPPYNDAAIENPTDPTERVFEFRTVTNSSSYDVFFGTSVYYRLYNSKLVMISNVTSINNVNDEYSDAAMNKMISLGFQPLAVGDSDVVVPASEGAVPVSIRLFDEGEYSANVTVSGQNMGIPLRMPSREGFSFYPANDEYPVPQETDGDVYYSSSGGEDWYVAAYAVSIGRSLELTPVYSEVLYLGYLSVSPDD